MNSGMQTIERPTKGDRIPALDFTKGALVLIMVLYHWINYFIGSNWAYYRYLRFLTPSFIFVTGFLISNVYLSRYRASDPRLGRRLFTRGLKLLAVFVVLNAARNLLLPRLSAGSIMTDQLDLKSVVAVFVSGNVLTTTGKAVAFYILVPISYLLLLSAGLLVPYRFYKHTFHAVCVFFLLCILVLNLNNLNSPNLEFVTIGLVGVLAGFIPIDRINNVVRHPYTLAIAYACYVIAITVWNVPFQLLIVGACLSVIAIYLLGLVGDKLSKARRHVILLGRYSLLGYIAQIAILQLLSAGLRHVNLGFAVLGISFFAAFALTMVTVEAVDRVKARSIIVDRLYRAVFA
jgi:peptidoglycan/LPS O-acetylase OafA/YrhL